VLKAYAFGLFMAALGVLLLAALWPGAPPKQEEGLVWGGAVYESRQEFDGYLKSRSLSYPTWRARNPNASPPWEGEASTLDAISVETPPKNLQLLLAGVGWVLATAGMILLVRGRGPGGGGLAPTAAAAFSGIMVLILAVGFWQSRQPNEPPGMRWGANVYTSKQDFNRYLKSKGLSYDTWLARNPAAAPWEPSYKPPAAETSEANAAGDDGFSWSLLLPGLALGAAVGGALLLLLDRRASAVPRLARRRPTIELPRLRAPKLGAPRLSVPRLSAPRLSLPRLSMPHFSAPNVRALRHHAPTRRGRGWGTASAGAAVSARRVSGATASAGRSVTTTAPRYGSRVGAVTRDAARLVLESAAERSIGPGQVAMALLVVAGAVVWGMMVAVVFS
jgi:hypothetical protein